MENFKQFDVVSDATGHHYVGSNLKGKEMNEKVTRRLTKEWRMLENSLPASIYVRVYEDRIDLLRAVIIGAPSTPYYNGLFFFDFSFPMDYPAQPPRVYYHSFGMRLNPNLYASGTVCLSLLNTWTGEKVEKWSPTSTILQVLVSLQALVLNGNPFFNEPMLNAVPGHLAWEKKSLAYNQGVWLKTCKTMMLLLRTPPKHFEQFVAGHFREQAYTIMLSCRAYVSGHAQVGEVVQVENTFVPGHVVSKNFRTRMVDVYRKLLDCFASAGVLREDVRAELMMLPKADLNKKKSGITKKIFKRFKKFFVAAKRSED